MTPELIQLVTLGGAAGVAIWIIKWAVDGKIHFGLYEKNPHVKELKSDKTELQKNVRDLTTALTASNDQLTTVKISLATAAERMRELEEENDRLRAKAGE